MYTFLSALPQRFLPDGEVWEWSEGVSHLLQSQHHLLSTDIQQCLLSLGAAQSVVTRILHNPADKECRNVSHAIYTCECVECCRRGTRTVVRVKGVERM